MAFMRLYSKDAKCQSVLNICRAGYNTMPKSAEAVQGM